MTIKKLRKTDLLDSASNGPRLWNSPKYKKPREAVRKERFKATFLE